MWFSMNDPNLSALDLNLLVAFDRVFAERSVKKAAHRLHLTPSAVSHALARLRIQMDDPLFVPSPRGMQPTAAAEELAERVAAVLREVGAIFAERRGFDPAASGRRFTLGMNDYMAFVVMPVLVARLDDAAPGIRIVALPTNRREYAGVIERGEADLVIGGAIEQPPSSISASPLYRDSSVCVGRRGHPALAGGLATGDLLGFAHLHISPWGELGYIEDQLRRHGLVRRIAHTVGHFLLAPAILERSDLLAILPRGIADAMTRTYALAMQDLPVDLGASDIVQMWHRRLDDDPGLRWLRGEIAALVSR
jgi:DNA-binding transcriptional LysR family regulator